MFIAIAPMNIMLISPIPIDLKKNQDIERKECISVVELIKWTLLSTSSGESFTNKTGRNKLWDEIDIFATRAQTLVFPAEI